MLLTSYFIETEVAGDVMVVSLKLRNCELTTRSNVRSNAWHLEVRLGRTQRISHTFKLRMTQVTIQYKLRHSPGGYRTVERIEGRRGHCHPSIFYPYSRRS